MSVSKERMLRSTFLAFRHLGLITSCPHVIYSEEWCGKSCHKYYKVKNAPNNIFDDTSMKSIHFFRKKCWKKYFFWIPAFFGHKKNHFFRKNGNICVAFEKWQSTLDGFEWWKGVKIVFLFFWIHCFNFKKLMKKHKPWSKLLEKVPATAWKKSELLKKCSDLLKKDHIFLPKHQP